MLQHFSDEECILKRNSRKHRIILAMYLFRNDECTYTRNDAFFHETHESRSSYSMKLVLDVASENSRKPWPADSACVTDSVARACESIPVKMHYDSRMGATAILAN